MKTETGYAVKITRDDGTSFLAIGSEGVMPVVCPLRRSACDYKRDLSTHFDKSRMKVVRVSYAYPEEMPA